MTLLRLQGPGELCNVYTHKNPLIKKNKRAGRKSNDQLKFPRFTGEEEPLNFKQTKKGHTSSSAIYFRCSAEFISRVKAAAPILAMDTSEFLRFAACYTLSKLPSILSQQRSKKRLKAIDPSKIYPLSIESIIDDETVDKLLRTFAFSPGQQAIADLLDGAIDSDQKAIAGDYLKSEFVREVKNDLFKMEKKTRDKINREVTEFVHSTIDTYTKFEKAKMVKEWDAMFKGVRKEKSKTTTRKNRKVKKV